MKRLLMITLALCLLCTGALAETRYTVLPAEIDDAVLLQTAFGAQVGEAQKNLRDDGNVFYDLPNTDGPPFCSQSASTVQNAFGAYAAAGADGLDDYIGSSNVWPTGVAECALTREEALAQADALVQSFGLGEYVLQSVTAYGRVPGFRDGYHVAFLQRLNGRAVYWSASSQPGEYGPNEDYVWKQWPETNRVVVVLDDQGMVRLSGAWCRYEPTGGELALMDEAQAVAAFAAMGAQANAPELCYLLLYDGSSATAIPAWRCQNSFLDAATGEWLQ